MTWWKKDKASGGFSDKESESGDYTQQVEADGEFRDKSVSGGDFETRAAAESSSVERERGVASEGRQGDDFLGVSQTLFYAQPAVVWDDVSSTQEEFSKDGKVPREDVVELLPDVVTVQKAMGTLGERFGTEESFHLEAYLPQDDTLAVAVQEEYVFPKFTLREDILPEESFRLETYIPREDAVQIGQDDSYFWRSEVEIVRDRTIVVGEYRVKVAAKVPGDDQVRASDPGGTYGLKGYGYATYGFNNLVSESQFVRELLGNYKLSESEEIQVTDDIAGFGRKELFESQEIKVAEHTVFGKKELFKSEVVKVKGDVTRFVQKDLSKSEEIQVADRIEGFGRKEFGSYGFGSGPIFEVDNE